MAKRKSIKVPEMVHYFVGTDGMYVLDKDGVKPIGENPVCPDRCHDDREDDDAVEGFAEAARFELVQAARDLLGLCGVTSLEERTALERLLAVFDPKPPIESTDPDIPF